MAGLVYKWLTISFFPLLIFQNGPFVQPTGQFRTGNEENDAPKKLHPFHVSVVEINHNAADKTLEVSCKIFTDDFEKVLEQNYKTKVDLINPPVKKAMDTLVKNYINAHLSIKVDGKPVQFFYLGFEHESEAIYGYVQVNNIATVKMVELVNKLMYDLFTDQVNLMHVIVGGNRKSSKLDYPESVAVFNF